ncbi:hypothetical protein Isop_2824 [Isosphaera pallida ATCC 43644]|uniref:Type II secretion system protein n=1 Tax=Isosphaera pallida (strain ATCC 43644 / DSM 9630 / IS1B) TaxID=575540 RepID=E8R139_ISOPI|nr:type II secretion system protein [Isosphaera pallida]ADV63390.1 hypothetical protein Isop_2824 [Isosphaera pallida ATCC 43644]
MPCEPPLPQPRPRPGRRAVPSTRSRRGFTLVELLIVIAVIGILVGLVVVASAGAVRTAELRATQSLISKLSVAVNDRLQALQTSPVQPNGAHRYLAATLPGPGLAYTRPDLTGPGPGQVLPVFNPNQVYAAVKVDNSPIGALSWGLINEDRAKVLALMDFIRMEMPDTFFVQADQPGAPYPLNFGGWVYPNPNAFVNVNEINPTLSNAILPLGNSAIVSAPGLPPPFPVQTPAGTFPVQLTSYLPNLRLDIPGGPMGLSQAGPSGCNLLNGTPFPPLININGSPDQTWERTGRGIFGASYSAAASIYKNLRYATAALDGVDNSPANTAGSGFADEFGENGTAAAQAQSALQRFYVNHDPITARSEMLYALLVEGVGPFGSVFSPDDFTEREVQDTDGDGLPEFVDAWGRPLQFYRNPVFYNEYTLVNGILTSDVRNPLGVLGYTPFEERQRNPLDPRNQLMAIDWWGETNTVNGSVAVGGSVFNPIDGTIPMSARARAVQAFLGPLSLFQTPAGRWEGSSNINDQTPSLRRRAFAAKPLILSAGPDGETGLYAAHRDPQWITSNPAQKVRMLIGVPPYQFNGFTFGNFGGFVGENNAAPDFLAPFGIGQALERMTDNITNYRLESTGGGLY